MPGTVLEEMLQYSTSLLRQTPRHKWSEGTVRMNDLLGAMVASSGEYFYRFHTLDESGNHIDT